METTCCQQMISPKEMAKGISLNIILTIKERNLEHHRIERAKTP